MEEKERQDESNLLETIDLMNKKFKLLSNNKQSFQVKENMDPNEESEYEVFNSNFNESLIFDSNSIDIKFSEKFLSFNEKDADSSSPQHQKNNSFSNASLMDKESNFNTAKQSPLASKISTAPNTLSLENSNISNMEAFLNQNLINFEHILKFMVIGDKATGKSLFVNRFISEISDMDTVLKTSYIPTER
jgi:hypothetical protein